MISIELGSVSSEMKAELIKKITKTAAEVTNIPEANFIMLIKEYPKDAIGIGGIPLSEQL